MFIYLSNNKNSIKSVPFKYLLSNQLLKDVHLFGCSAINQKNLNVKWSNLNNSCYSCYVIKQLKVHSASIDLFGILKSTIFYSNKRATISCNNYYKVQGLREQKV